MLNGSVSIQKGSVEEKKLRIWRNLKKGGVRQVLCTPTAMTSRDPHKSLWRKGGLEATLTFATKLRDKFANDNVRWQEERKDTNEKVSLKSEGVGR